MSALEVYIKLSRAAEAIATRINIYLKDENLTLSQFGVLEAIYHLGPMYQNQLGEKILKSGGNMTMVIDNLEKRSLVERERDPNDRRCVMVRLTQSGHNLIDTLFPRHVQIVLKEIGVLTPEEQTQLAALCKKVGLGQVE